MVSEVVKIEDQWNPIKEYDWNSKKGWEDKMARIKWMF